MVHLGLKIIEIWKFYLSIENTCTQQNHCFASEYVECINMMALKKKIRDYYLFTIVF